MLRSILTTLAVLAVAGGTAMAADPAYESGPVDRPATSRHETGGSSGGMAPSPHPAGPADTAPRAPAASDARRGTTDATSTDPSGSVVQGTQISGRISDLDREDGTVRIDLSNGEAVTLVFPQSSLASFNKGDPVTLTAQVGMAETPPSAGTQRPGFRDDDVDDDD